MTGRSILTAAETLAAEETAMAQGVGVDELMERAGRAVADAAWRLAGKTPTLILCGPGNNGGDGYVAARLLAERGCEVRIASLGDPKTDAAIAMRQRWEGTVEPIAGAKGAPLVIDALFGTGLKRALSIPLAQMLGDHVRAAKFSVAVDLPSGVETDSGALLSSVPDFNTTVALGALKPANRLQPAARHCGHVLVGDIGLGGTSDLAEISPPSIAAPGPDDHKYTRGYVFVAEGAMAGAASLCAHAAMRSGAGYVVMAGPERGEGPQALIMRQAADPKTLGKLLTDERIDVAVAGPGLGRERKARARLDAVLGSGKKLVLDADALMVLAEREGPARLKELEQTAIVTPHEGEFARFFGDLEGSKVDRARAAAAASGSVVIYKGADTVVAAPDGRAAIAPPSPPWLASAGTGDVLAGVAAARYAQLDDAFEAACEAVWLHGEAAHRTGPFLIADDLIAALPATLASCL
ncbi:MAG: NAD(P)H-hydrate dehydratase [Sphingomonadaceae bacterium]|nr:NAD(P)H-hydrate dehydratase [Sphingomonadaceae bacterium]